MKTDLEKVRKLAKDLRKGYPRSPREKLAGYVIAARCVDKCRASLLGMNGDYSYWPCSLASHLFSFTGITPEQLKGVVATGATDAEVASWIASASKVKDSDEVLRWNNAMRDTKLSDMRLSSIWKSTFRSSCRTIALSMYGSMCTISKKSGSRA
jgi:hypothetical protein